MFLRNAFQAIGGVSLLSATARGDVDCSGGYFYSTNAEIPGWRLDEVAPLSAGAAHVLERELRKGSLSARGLHRIRRVARTLADLAGGGTELQQEHVCGALELRVAPPMLQAWAS